MFEVNLSNQYTSRSDQYHSMVIACDKIAHFLQREYFGAVKTRFADSLAEQHDRKHSGRNDDYSAPELTPIFVPHRHSEFRGPWLCRANWISKSYGCGSGIPSSYCVVSLYYSSQHSAESAPTEVACTGTMSPAPAAIKQTSVASALIQ